MRRAISLGEPITPDPPVSTDDVLTYDKVVAMMRAIRDQRLPVPVIAFDYGSGPDFTAWTVRDEARPCAGIEVTTS